MPEGVLATTPTPTRAPGEVARALLGTTLVAALGLAAWFAFPEDLGLLTRVFATGTFVLSLYLVTGLAGIATLGHAVVFGAGAYAAGYACAGGVAEPLALIALGALGGTLMGALYGALLLRARGLSQLVLSIAAVQVVAEAANKATPITGGSDGLSGFLPGPVLGRFDLDIYGRTGALLALAVLTLAYLLVALLARSPFGLACRAIRADEGRVRALGLTVGTTLFRLFLVSGAIAGAGGAVSAIATGVVGLDSVGFELSAEALVMLVLGGLGGPAGALIGTAVFMVFQHEVSAVSPYHWLAIIGLLLILVVRFLPGGLLSLATRRR